MARNLDSELARLSRVVRRRVRLQEARKIAAENPVRVSHTERLALIWDRARARVRSWLRWLRR